MHEKFKTWLPVFNGFYNSFWDDPDISFEVENIEKYGFRETEFYTYFFKNYSDIEQFIWENTAWGAFYNDLSEKFCKILEQEINDKFADLMIKIKFEKLIRPKEYNFRNDAIDCEISLNLPAFKKWLYENKDFIDSELKKRYTSRDGFISRYRNNFADWEKNTKNFNFLGFHYLGALLDILCKKLEIKEEIFYYQYDIYWESYIAYENAEKWAKINDVEIKEVFHDPKQLKLNI